MMTSTVKTFAYRVLLFAMILVMVAACSTTDEATEQPEPTTAAEAESVSASALVIENAWVRPAVSGTGNMDMDTEATDEPMDMDAEATDEPMDMGTPMGGMTGAFMVIANNGNADDILINAFTDVAGVVEIHETTVDENDVARMQEVGQIIIPAGESVALQPGGYHMMLMDLQQDLVAGETVEITLEFESGIELTVEAAIQETPPED